MFDYALETIKRLKKNEVRRIGKFIIRASLLKSFRTGVIWGMRTALMEIIKQRESSQKDEPQSYALVLRDKSKKIDDFVNRDFSVMDMKSGTTYFHDKTFFQRGVIAGSAVSFQKQAGAKTHPKELE